MAQIRYVVFEKSAKNAHLFPKMTFRKAESSESLKLSFNLLTAFFRV